MDYGISSIANSFLPYGELVAENNRLFADNARLVEEKRLLTEEKRLLNEEKHRLHIENCTFRGKVEEAKIALVEVKNRAGADEEKYFELVSVARGHPPKSNRYQVGFKNSAPPNTVIGITALIAAC